MDYSAIRKRFTQAAPSSQLSQGIGTLTVIWSSGTTSGLGGLAFIGMWCARHTAGANPCWVERAGPFHPSTHSRWVKLEPFNYLTRVPSWRSGLIYEGLYLRSLKYDQKFFADGLVYVNEEKKIKCSKSKYFFNLFRGWNFPAAVAVVTEIRLSAHRLYSPNSSVALAWRQQTCASVCFSGFRGPSELRSQCKKVGKGWKKIVTTFLIPIPAFCCSKSQTTPCLPHALWTTVTWVAASRRGRSPLAPSRPSPRRPRPSSTYPRWSALVSDRASVWLRRYSVAIGHNGLNSVIGLSN